MPFTLNPFRKLRNGKSVWAWGMYDLANQSFQLLINTLLFGLFVKEVIFIDDPERGRSAWTFMAATGLLLIVVLSPILGAIADQKAWKRELLLASGVVAALFTAALGFLQPGQIALAFGFYVIAAVACGLGENFLGSFLPQISTPKNVGYISALGWTMSYIGALLLLGITAAYAFGFGRTEPEQARPLFFFAGVWFGAGILPAFILLRETARPQPESAGTIIASALKRLAASARESQRYKHLARFFIAFFVYSLGTQTVIYFLGLISDELGNSLAQTILFALVVACTAGVASAIVAKFQDRVGHKRTVSAFLVIWVVSTLALAAIQRFDVPVACFWIVSGLIGVGLGGIGTSSRSIVGAFSPDTKSGEFFGVWGMVYKLSGIVGVLAFGFVRTQFGLPASLLIIAAFFAAGLALLARVNEQSGIAAAQTEPPEPTTPL